MIIKEIDLQNVRSHGSTTVTFREGINVITGNTGSGKSSMLMALEYALFGKIGEGREEGKMLLRRGEQSGSISVTFEENGSEYTVKRGLKRVGDAVRNDDSVNIVIKDGNAVDLQNRASDLNDYVLKVLKIESDAPVKTFESITYIKQDELKDLIFDSGQSKQEYIDQLLQLNKYVDTYSVLKDVIDLIRKEMEDKKLEEALAVDENDLIKIESRINELRVLNEKAKGELEAAENELKDSKLRLEQEENKLKLHRDKKDEYTKLSAEKEEKESRIKKLGENISSLENAVAKKSAEIANVDDKRENKVKEELKALDTRRSEKLQAEKTAYNSLSEIKALEKSRLERISALGSELDSLSSERGELEKELENAAKALENAGGTVTVDELKGRLSQLDMHVAELEKEKTEAVNKKVCPVCGERITDTGHVDKEYSSRIARHRALIDTLSNEIKKEKKGKTKADLEKEIGILNSRLEGLSKMTAAKQKELGTIDIEDIKKNSLEREKVYETLLSEEKTLSQELSRLNAELDSINAVRNSLKEIEMDRVRIESFRAERSKLDKEIESTESKLNGIGFKQEELDAAENAHKNISGQIQELAENASHIKGNVESRVSEIADNESKLGEIKVKIKKRDEFRKEAEKKEGFLALMENLRKDIRDIREYVRNRFINDFKSLFQSRFAEIRSDSEYTIDIDNDYNVKVVVENETMDAKALSGGEKTSVALAYRMALSSIASLLGGVSKNESLLMDEPTSGLDREDINSLSSCITRITDINQIVIVTHEDTMKNIADNLVSVSKVSGESRVSTSK